MRRFWTSLALTACIWLGAGGQTPAGRDSTSPPLIATFSYAGELVHAALGGAGGGTAYAGAAGAQLTILLRQLIGWPGARLFAFALDTHGGAPGSLVGDVQGVSNLEAPPALRLEELWLQQNLFGNRLSWLVGRYDLGTEFYRLQSGALFINSSFGIGPEFGHSGAAGPSIFPNPAVGTRIDLKPTPTTVWRVALLDGVPVDRPTEAIRLFAPGDGVLVVSEVALLARPDTAGEPRHRRFAVGRGLTRSYAGKLALGAWYYTARFADLVDTLPNGARTQHRGSGGAYLIGDETVGSFTLFAQLGLGDGRINQIAGYVGGGLTLTGPLPGRALDALGLAVAAARNGSHFERAEAFAGVPTAGETTLELTYAGQLTSWVTVQPDRQYVMHPGGTSLSRNALVLGLRVAGQR